MPACSRQFWGCAIIVSRLDSSYLTMPLRTCIAESCHRQVLDTETLGIVRGPTNLRPRVDIHPFRVVALAFALFCYFGHKCLSQLSDTQPFRPARWMGSIGMRRGVYVTYPSSTERLESKRSLNSCAMGREMPFALILHKFSRFLKHLRMRGLRNGERELVEFEQRSLGAGEVSRRSCGIKNTRRP